jgi:molybdopterin molybdotransferase
VLKRGTRIKPQHVAILASVGATRLKVYKNPSIGVISTGDELVEPDQVPGISQIRNSNAWQIIAQVKATGAESQYYGIALDDRESTYEKISESLQNNDITILTGGVSMGEYDFVPDIMQDLGIQLKFQRIAIQPGKPTIFGVKGNKLCFGLPGNPVSSFVLFELLVRPLIAGLTGHEFTPLNIKLPMAADYSRKKSIRRSWIPVRINENSEIEPVEYHGSAHIYSLNKTVGFISIPVGETILKKGDYVHVRLI